MPERAGSLSVCLVKARLEYSSVKLSHRSVISDWVSAHVRSGGGSCGVADKCQGSCEVALSSRHSHSNWCKPKCMFLVDSSFSCNTHARYRRGLVSSAVNRGPLYSECHSSRRVTNSRILNGPRSPSFALRSTIRVSFSRGSLDIRNPLVLSDEQRAG